MRSKIKKVYVAGALTYVEEADKFSYEKLGAFLQQNGLEVFVPHMWGNDPIKDYKVIPSKIWKINQRQISTADLVVAYVGKPSLGVGAELEITRVSNVKLLLWAFEGEKISRMALGNPAVLEVLIVKNEEDLFKKIKNKIKTSF